MNQIEQNEFYVGYLPHAPQRNRRWVRWFCALLISALSVTAMLLVNGQRPFPQSFFEYKQYRQFEGVVRAQPYPTLLVARPGETGQAPAFSAYLLVAPGKHGAAVAAYDNLRVRLQGALIYRDGMTMIEIVPDSLNPGSNDSPLANPSLAGLTPQTLGVFTLRGEIVDSKCYLGVMNPGQTKPHRECAVRCISGGIPPLFIARAHDGQTVSLLLVSATGAPVNQAVLELVAEPVEITGEAVREGEQLFLRADPMSYRRLGKVAQVDNH